MPPAPDPATAAPAPSRHSAFIILAVTAAGFGLTLLVFYPGVMTYDARFVYEDIAKGFLGDWQSPVMTVLWALIDPVAPGPASMFLLIVTSYWLAFGLLALTMARRSLPWGLVLLVLAASPPAFAFAGIIWRDVLFAVAWLLAAALVFAVADRDARLRGPIQAVALGLLAFGVLLRPNALAAAPILAGFILWPARFYWKRTAILLVPAALALFGLVQLTYYDVLGATRQHPLHSIMVFDLGGISHFTGQNQFPVTWTVAETTLVTGGCYQPTQWDIYWRSEPCEFVMQRLERDRIFGSPLLVNAWASAIASHPGAYIRHRAAFMWNFLAGENLTLWTHDLDDPSKLPLAGRPAFAALKAVHDALKPTPLFRAGSWLLICVGVCIFAWRRRNTPSGAMALGICGSAAIYALSFLAVGVASDFRYAYWAVLAGITGAVAVAQSFRELSAAR